MRLSELTENDYLVYEAKMPAHVIQEDDIEIIGVFVLPNARFLANFNYKETPKVITEINPFTENLCVYYELREFIKQLSSGNPNAILALFAEEDDIITKKEPINELLLNRQKFITKKCLYSFVFNPVSLCDREFNTSKLIFDSKVLTDTDLFHLLPNSRTAVCVPLTKWMTTTTGSKSPVSNDEIALVSIPGVKDVYQLYCSYKLHFQKINQTKGVFPSYPGINIKNGVVQTYQMGTDKDKETEWPMSFIGPVSFNREAYNANESLKRTIARRNKQGGYNALLCSKIFTLTGEGISLAYRGTPKEEIDSNMVSAQIRNRQYPLRDLKGMFEARVKRAQAAYSGIPEAVDQEFLHSVEITIRGRHALLSVKAVT